MISLVYVTCSTMEEAQHISTRLLDDNLIACANILPNMTSLYRWKGKLQTSSEIVLLLKTPAGKVDEVLAKIKEIHPYDTPCALELPIKKGLESYMDWVVSETEEPKE